MVNEEMVEMTQSWAALVFEEWKRRYDQDPDGSQSCAAFKDDPPQSYGEGAARYFMWLDQQMGEPVNE